MPMQRIESIDEPRRAAAATGQLELFEQQNPKQDDFSNWLIWGDNKLVMASLLQEFKGKVDLIYIDPPFDVGANFSMSVAIGDEQEAIEKEQSTLEMFAYRDIWGKGTDSYLHMLHERLTLISELLSEKGNIFVHCDWHVNYMARTLLDDVFGSERFVNEIVWYYNNKMQGNVNRFAANHDIILWYSKSPKFVFNPQKEKRDETVKQLKRVWDKEKGKLVNAKGADGKVIYIETDERTVDDVWRLSMLQPADRTENLDYATQKPETLIERIIQASSNEGDLVADFFCGSGTTGVVAERLGRRWLMCDLGRFAIHTSRKRMIELQRKLHSKGKPYRAFDVYNLGRYERQWWQKDRLQGADEEHRRVILEFFKAEVLTNTPSPLLHGRKAGAFCHVDGIDSMFTREEAKLVAQATAQAGGRECYCLAWEFEMDLHLLVNALVQELGVKLKLVQIPREIMEKNRKAPPPFLEVAVLAAEAVYRKDPHPLTPSPKVGEERQEGAAPLSRSGRGAGGEGNSEKEYWEISPALKKKMTEVARQFRKEPTPSEDILWQALRGRKLEGRKFRRQQPIGAFVVDFFCGAERLIVEVDGGVHESQQEADQQRQELLESLGLRVVRISSELVETKLDEALAVVCHALSPHPLTPSPKKGEGEQDPAPLSPSGLPCIHKFAYSFSTKRSGMIPRVAGDHP
jgi:adenine-specific DNA-methyltransferase